VEGSAASAVASSSYCWTTASTCAPWCIATTTAPIKLRALGAEVVVGDLTRAGGYRRRDARRQPDVLQHERFGGLLAGPPPRLCAAALERGQLDAIVNMSQMTVSQMTADEHR